MIDWKSVAVRITDGPVKATVYQWPVSANVNVKAMTGTTMGISNGLKFLVAADIPEIARKKILNSFIEAARSSSVQPPMGLVGISELCGGDDAFTRAEAVLEAMNLCSRLPADL